MTYLIVVLAVLAFVSGTAFLVRRRARSRIAEAPAPPTEAPPPPQTAPPRVIEAPPAPVEEVEEAPPPAEAPPHAPPSPVIEAPPAVEAPPAEVAPPKPTLRERLFRARGFGQALSRALGRTTLSEEDWEEVEEILLRADVGVAATQRIVSQLREAVRSRGGDDHLALLREQLVAALGEADRSLTRSNDGLTVWLVTGVNGTGKTTTIGKLAAALREEGKTVVLGAADTFRAAADEQLERWGALSEATVISQRAGADPAAVAFDAVAAARARNADVLIVDTAGRMHTKRNLMEELGKIRRVVEREAGPPHEVLLVLDATTGQNGIQQARVFGESVAVTGIVLTKLDGTAKGGIVIGVQQELGVPVKLVGVGEGAADLAPFDPEAFVDALLRP